MLAFILFASPSAEGRLGAGVRTGKLLVRPEVFMELGYTSNLFFNSSGDPSDHNYGQDGPVDTALLKLLPSVGLETLPSADFQLSAHGQLEVIRYLADHPRLNDASTQLGLHLDVAGASSRHSSLFLEFLEQFHVRPVAGTNLAELEQIENYNHIQNTTEIRGVIRPNRGVLTFRPGYRLLWWNFFNNPKLNSLEHDFVLRADWKFMPKTAILLDGSIGSFGYYNEASKIPDATPLRVKAGLRGLLTPKLSLDLEAGYGNSFHDSGESFSGPLVVVRFTERFTERMVLDGGYRYDMQLAAEAWSNYAGAHQADLRWQQQIASKFNLGATITYQFLSFSRLNYESNDVQMDGPTVVENRTDHRYGGQLQLEWHPNDWLSVLAGYQLRVLRSSAIVRDRNTGNLSNPDYNLHLAFTRIGLVF